MHFAHVDRFGVPGVPVFLLALLFFRSQAIYDLALLVGEGGTPGGVAFGDVEQGVIKPAEGIGGAQGVELMTMALGGSFPCLRAGQLVRD